MVFDLNTGQFRKRGTVATGPKKYRIQFENGYVDFWREKGKTHYRASCQPGYAFNCMKVVEDPTGNYQSVYESGTSSRGIRQFKSDLLEYGGKLVKIPNK